MTVMNAYVEACLIDDSLMNMTKTIQEGYDTLEMFLLNTNRLFNLTLYITQSQDNTIHISLHCVDVITRINTNNKK